MGSGIFHQIVTWQSTVFVPSLLRETARLNLVQSQLCQCKSSVTSAAFGSGLVSPKDYKYKIWLWHHVTQNREVKRAAEVDIR